MKKLLFLILFFSISAMTFGANVYFLNGGPGYVYTNGQTFNSNQNGYASVYYWIWADPARYNYGHCGANFQDPDGNWTGWSDLGSGSQGMHHCLKAGTWHVKGRVWVYGDAYGGSNYWMETSFILYFYVVDNYSPAVPQNFDITVYSTGDNANPKLTWTLNTEADGDKYYIERRVTGQQNFSFLATVNWTTNQYMILPLKSVQ